MIEIVADHPLRLAHLEFQEVRMKLKSHILMFIYFIFFATVLKAQAPQSKSYSYPSDGFQITFPAEPTLSKSNVETQAGPFELRSYVSAISSTAYYVGVCDYGKDAAGKDPDDMLQGAKDGAMANTNSHLIKEEKIKLSIVHGLAFECENDKAYFTARVYMAGSMLYQVVVIYPIGIAPPDATSFLDSFGLITRSEQ
jgi:hypothetical protein